MEMGICYGGIPTKIHNNTMGIRGYDFIEFYSGAGKMFAYWHAKAMGLEKGEFDLRSNKGGIAVSGEVTLHSDNAYIQVSQSMGRANVLYRSCNGRKDYSGGQNQYVDVSKLLDDSTISKFQSL